MIPESFIQEVLNRIDVVDIVDQRVKLKKAGANYVACCPFHQEKSPSFTVSPSKQFYHCFGCGAHGSAISFLMEYEGLTFIESIQSIASQLGLSVPNEQTTSKSDKSDYLILEQALMQANQFYKKNLRASKEAIHYLKNRGVSGEIAKQFQIGFANQEWQGLQQVFKNYDDAILQSAGLCFQFLMPKIILLALVAVLFMQTIRPNITTHLKHPYLKKVMNYTVYHSPKKEFAMNKIS